MVKHYVISILGSIILCGAIVFLVYTISLPQIEPLSSEVVPKYTSIENAEFDFVETKHFVTEILSRKYTIDTNDITNFENNKLYVPGNYDPFTPPEKIKETVQNSTQTEANKNNNNSNTSSNSSGTVISGTTK